MLTGFVFGYLAALATVVLSVIVGRIVGYGLGRDYDPPLSQAWRNQHLPDERNTFDGVCWRWPVRKD